jgi:hypothetical protein
MCNPQLVPDRPDLISVIFFGHRETIDRIWYDKTMWLSRCQPAALEKARLLQSVGELSPLDDEYWRRA